MAAKRGEGRARLPPYTCPGSLSRPIFSSPLPTYLSRSGFIPEEAPSGNVLDVPRACDTVFRLLPYNGILSTPSCAFFKPGWLCINSNLVHCAICVFHLVGAGVCRDETARMTARPHLPPPPFLPCHRLPRLSTLPLLPLPAARVSSLARHSAFWTDAGVPTYRHHPTLCGVGC